MISRIPRLLALPGIVIHELAHYYFCLLAGARVHDVVFFSFGYPAGYVVHTAPRRYSSHLLITLGPLVVNTLLAILLFAVVRTTYGEIAAVGLTRADGVDYARLLVSGWLSASVALQALPSTGDAASLWQVTSWHLKHRHYFVVLGLPVVGLIYAANYLRAVFIDWFYAAGLGVLTWWLVGRS